MYYLQLQQGKSIRNPDNGVIITEGIPPEAKPVLFINNQVNTQSNTGISTKFYILMYWNLETKQGNLQPFYVKEITANEEVVNQFANIEIPEGTTTANISDITEIQLYTYLLNLPLVDNNGEVVLNEDNNPVLLFADWELKSL
jgi:hypothetical protein